MPNETVNGDILHGALLDILSNEYLHTATGDSQDTIGPEVSQFLKESASWKGDREWPMPTYNDDTGEPTLEYRRALIGAIGNTLISLRSAISASGIFTEAEKSLENGDYQQLMAVLATPKGLAPLEWNPEDMEGLLIRDLAFNHRYWKDTDSHLRLMRNTCAALEKMFAIKDTPEGTEKAKQALKEMFPYNKSLYNLCPAEHSYRVKTAKSLLSNTPQETLVAYWNRYIQDIMKESPSEGSPSISERIQPGNHLHFPFFADYLAGVPADLVGTHDKNLGSGILGLDDSCLSLVTERLFEFPKWLIADLNGSIEDLMAGFDQLESIAKQNTVVYQIERDILTPWRGRDHEEGFMNSIFVFGEDETESRFEKSEIIKEKAKELVANGICELAGLEKIPLEALSKLEVSLEKRLSLRPINNRAAIWLLGAYARKSDADTTLKKIVEACPEDNRSMVIGASMYSFAKQGETECMERLFNTLSEDLRLKALIDALVGCSKLRDIEPLQKVIAMCYKQPNSYDLIALTLADCAKNKNINSLQRILITCPESHVKEKVAGNMLYHFAKQNNPLADYLLKLVLERCQGKTKERGVALGLIICVYRKKTSGIAKIINTCTEPEIKKKGLLMAMQSIRNKPSSDQNSEAYRILMNTYKSVTKNQPAQEAEITGSRASLNVQQKSGTATISSSAAANDLNTPQTPERTKRKYTDSQKNVPGVAAAAAAAVPQVVDIAMSQPINTLQKPAKRSRKKTNPDNDKKPAAKKRPPRP